MSCVGLDFPWDSEPFWSILAQPYKKEVSSLEEDMTERITLPEKSQLQNMDPVSGLSIYSDTFAETSQLSFLDEVDSLLDLTDEVQTTSLTDLNSVNSTPDTLPPVFIDIPQSSSNPSNTIFPQPLSSTEEDRSVQVSNLPLNDSNLNIHSKDELEISDVDCEDSELNHSMENGQISNGTLPAVETVFSRNQVDGTSEDKNQPSPSYSNHTQNTNNARSYQKKNNSQPLLYLVLFHALEHPEHYLDMIRWIDRPNGIFEFSSKNKENFALAWGKVKNNRCPMTYQKMSRALRIYMKKKVVLTKMKRKLQYVFRPDTMNELLTKSTGKIVSSKIADIMYKESRS